MGKKKAARPASKQEGPAPKQWADFLSAFDLWWAEVTDFVNSDFGHEPDRSAFNAIHEIVAFVYDYTAVDPTKFWVLHQMASDRLQALRGFPGDRKLPTYRHFDRQIMRLRCGPGISPDKGQPAHEKREQAQAFSDPPPENADIRDLAIELDAANGSGKSWRSIALGFTRNDVSKAESLLSQLRKLRSQGRCFLECEQ